MAYESVIKSGMARVRTSLTMEPEMLARVRQLAADMGTSMSEVVEVAVAMHMPQLEAMWAAAQAAKEGEDAEEAAMMAGLRAILHTLKREEIEAT